MKISINEIQEQFKAILSNFKNNAEITQIENYKQEIKINDVTYDNIKIRLMNVINKFDLDKEFKHWRKNHNALVVDVKDNIKEDNIISYAERLAETNSKELKKKAIKNIPVAFDPLSNVMNFYNYQPFFYDKSNIFWLWDDDIKKYNIVDEVDIMNKIEELFGLYGQTINSKVKNEYLEAFKRVGRTHIPKETPVKWLQFKDKAYSIKSNKIYEVTPDYFFTNPIPYELGKTTDTPTMDKLFREWVGDKYLKDLYEIIAYCCYRDYPIQIMFCLYGTGRNGKSQFIKLLNKFLGIENVCSTELDLLANPSSRFESIKLYKKLMCSMGETNFGTLSNTSMLKKLVGGDLIGFEIKNKTPFSAYNYAKILIGSNSLPSTDDTSDGFMRRWNIIDFPNEFKEGKDIIGLIPETEFNNLAKKITEILPNLLEKGFFNNQGTIAHRKERYIMASNPLPLFIQNHCINGHNKHILYSRLYTEYVKYLINNKKRKVKMKEFKSSLENEGYYIEKTAFSDENNNYKNGYYVIGLDFDNIDNIDNISNSLPYRETNVNSYQKSQNYQKYKQEKVEQYSLSPTEMVFSRLEASRDNEIQITEDFENTIKKMIKEGNVFENRPGFIKRL